MKKVIPLILPILFCINSFYMPEKMYVVAEAGLVLRASPSRSAPAIRVIPKNSIVKILGVHMQPNGDSIFEIINGISDQWYYVKYEESEGWLFGGYLRDPQTEFMLAAKESDFARMKTALSFGANPNQRIYGGDSALLFAAENPNPEVTNFLLEFHPSTEIKNDALQRAIVCKNLSVMRALLEHGADPNGNPSFGSGDFLLMAVRDENIEAVRMLLEFGANPNKPDVFGITPIEKALESKNKVLIEALQK